MGLKKTPTLRKKRKPMSDEQRAAASDRLAKARLARGHDGSKSVHPILREMDEDHPLHWKKVKGWIKEVGEELRAKKQQRLSKDSKERLEYQILEVYLSNMKRYLESSIWLDHRYGRHREGKMNTFVYTMAYDANGRPKRTIGHFYSDCGEYTKEMKEHDDRVYASEPKGNPRTGGELYEPEEVLEDGGDDCQT